MPFSGPNGSEAKFAQDRARGALGRRRGHACHSLSGGRPRLHVLHPSMIAGREGMRSEPYFHPEFGCLAPTSRFRREVRLGFLSLLFGIGIGVAAVTALSTATRDRDSGWVSPVQSADADASLPTTKTLPDSGKSSLSPAGRTNAATNEKGNLPINASQPAAPAGNLGNSGRDAKTSCQNDDLTCLSDGRSSAKPRSVSRPTQITDLGRLPLGRSDASASSAIPSDGSPAVTPRAPYAPTAPNVMPQKTTAGTIRKEDPAAGRDSTSLSRKIPQKTPRTQNPERRKAPASYASREDRAGREVPPDEEARRPYARSASSPKGFWAWSW
jgi:hypothetical protein